MKTQYIRINTGTFPIEAFLFIGGEYDNGLSVLQKKKLLSDRDVSMLYNEFKTGGGFSIMFEQSTAIIWVSKQIDDLSFLGVLIHELTHLTFQIMNQCGVDYDKEGANEVFCYQLELMVIDVLNKLKTLIIKK